MDKKEQTKIRVQRYRDKQKALQGEAKCNATDVTHHPAILYALLDPINRKKLEAVTLELKKHNVADQVRYGVSGPTFDIVGELLDVT